MIRFKPDTWPEAFLRFFAMAAPDGNVYVEIAAPDLRFAAATLLALLLMVFRRRLVANPRPALGLFALVLVSAIPWMLTSGNGRYWVPMLLCVGPLALGLIYLLPLSKAFRLFLAGGLLAAQTVVVLQTSPFGSWAWLAWRQAPYFQLELPTAEPGAPATTYVTLSSISYSLIAPQFPASSRWLNLTSIGGTGRDLQWGQQFLAAAPGPVKLIAPSIQGKMGPGGQPTPEVRQALDALLRSSRLALVPDADCEVLESDGLAAISGRGTAAGPGNKPGFWLCPLRYPVDRPVTEHPPVAARTEGAFERVERMCPRFFPPKSARTLAINGGALRHYGESDMKVYVMDDGQVLYKFWRALNPVLIGRIDAVLDGTAKMACDRITGRSGLPWEREI